LIAGGGPLAFWTAGDFHGTAHLRLRLDDAGVGNLGSCAVSGELKAEDRFGFFYNSSDPLLTERTIVGAGQCIPLLFEDKSWISVISVLKID